MDCTDEELVAAFRRGDKAAGEQLLTRNKNAVLSIARRFFLYGGDSEDLVQEGMCGLYSAMTSFEGASGFSAYAYSCVKNRILDAVRRSGSNKNLALNGFIPLGEGEDALPSTEFSPEEKLLGSEEKREFTEIMKGALSPLEYRAICLYIDGCTLPEISAELNKTYKQTDNAIARAKSKLRRVYEK